MCSWRKYDLAACITPPEPKILILAISNLVTLDDLVLTQGHKRLKRVFRSIPDTIRVVPSSLFQFHTATLPGEASNDSPKLTFDPACDAISSVQIKFYKIFGKVKPGAIKCRFRIKNRSSSLTDSKGRGETDPHRRSWSGNTPSGRGLKRLSKSFQILFFVYFFIASIFKNCYTKNDIELFLSLLIY